MNYSYPARTPAVCLVHYRLRPGRWSPTPTDKSKLASIFKNYSKKDNYYAIKAIFSKEINELKRNKKFFAKESKINTPKLKTSERYPNIRLQCEPVARTAGLAGCGHALPIPRPSNEAAIRNVSSPIASPFLPTRNSASNHKLPLNVSIFSTITGYNITPDAKESGTWRRPTAGEEAALRWRRRRRIPT